MPEFGKLPPELQGKAEIWYLSESQQCIYSELREQRRQIADLGAKLNTLLDQIRLLKWLLIPFYTAVVGAVGVWVIKGLLKIQ